MADFLKKLNSENFRLRYLKFSEIDSWRMLENHTRIKSFILKGHFEIACNKWYVMYISIVNTLQEIQPIDYGRLLSLNPVTGRCKPFMDHLKAGYLKTNYGLFIREAGSANKTIMMIKWILDLYGYDLDDAYLVVELTPDCVFYYSDEIIKEEKEELLHFLKETFVNSNSYYEMTIKAIDELNHALQYYTHTTYNNLYLLNENDFDRYANSAIERQLFRPGNTFTRRELTLSVAWIKQSRFYNNDYINPEHKTSGECFIEDGFHRIPVAFKTYFVGGDNHE